jgi:hypothetical protein
MLFPQPLKNAPGGVPLLGGPLLVFLQPLPDHFLKLKFDSC